MYESVTFSGIMTPLPNYPYYCLVCLVYCWYFVGLNLEAAGRSRAYEPFQVGSHLFEGRRRRFEALDDSTVTREAGSKNPKRAGSSLLSLRMLLMVGSGNPAREKPDA